MGFVSVKFLSSVISTAHLFEAGYDIRTAQELLGHRDVQTKMIYAHVRNRGGRGVEIPADSLARTGGVRR